MAWLNRCFVLLVAAAAIAGIASGAACTRRGLSTPLPPTSGPSTTIYVDPRVGNDSTGNGTQTKPYRTLTKAVSVLPSPVPSASTSPLPLTIAMNAGDYKASNGEKFPIVLRVGVILQGSAYGHGADAGTFIDGAGEDTAYEALAHRPARTSYTTLEVAPGVDVTMGNVYVGDTNVSVPSRASYAAVDVLGTLAASLSSFPATLSHAPGIGGVLVPSGTLDCASCGIGGTDYGVAAVTVPNASATPTVSLSHSGGDATVAAAVVGILTDGSADVSVSDVTFEGSTYAYEDAFPPLLRTGRLPGIVDFGGGPSGSPGNNILLGARSAEIALTLPNQSVWALDDTWNPGVQGANASGQFTKRKYFRAGRTGKNITIASNALHSVVVAGPAVAPTPSPSPTTYPSGYPSSSPSPSTSPT